MILRQNREELTAIVERMEALFPGCGHELRTPFFFLRGDGTSLDPGLLLTGDEYARIRVKLVAVGKRLEIGPPFTLEDYNNIMENTTQEGRRAMSGVHLGVYYGMRISADGRGRFDQGKEEFDLKEIDDVPGYFRKQLDGLQEAHARDCLAQEGTYPARQARDGAIVSTMSEVALYDDAYLHVKGWAFHKDGKEREKYVLLQDGEHLVYRARMSPRPDVAERFMDERYGKNAGLDCLIDIRPIREKLQSGLKITLGLADGDRMLVSPVRLKGNL